MHVGQRQAPHVLAQASRLEQRRSECLRPAGVDPDRDALDGQRYVRLSALEHRDDAQERRELVEDNRGSSVARTRATSYGNSHDQRGSPATSAPRAAASDAARARLRSSVKPRRARGGRSSPSRILASVAGPIRHRANATLVERGPELGDRRDVELSAQGQHAVRAEPDDAPERDELGRELRLELAELGDLPRLDELAQLLLDAGPDPPQLRVVQPGRLGGRCRERRINSAARR